MFIAQPVSEAFDGRRTSLHAEFTCTVAKTRSAHIGVNERPLATAL
jgi:hypothetical protein